MPMPLVVFCQRYRSRPELLLRSELPRA
jgi:hypothetical protein